MGHLDRLGKGAAVAAAAAKLRQSCPTLCNPIDGSPPGSSFHGIFQPRIQGCVTIPFSREILFYYINLPNCV